MIIFWLRLTFIPINFPGHLIPPYFLYKVLIFAFLIDDTSNVSFFISFVTFFLYLLHWICWFKTYLFFFCLQGVWSICILVHVSLSVCPSVLCPSVCLSVCVFRAPVPVCNTVFQYKSFVAEFTNEYNFLFNFTPLFLNLFLHVYSLNFYIIYLTFYCFLFCYFYLVNFFICIYESVCMGLSLKYFE